MIARTRNERRELADACDRCARERTDVPPTLPTTVHADGRDGLVATYVCRRGHRWSTWFALDADPAHRGSRTHRVTRGPEEPAHR